MIIQHLEKHLGEMAGGSSLFDRNIHVGATYFKDQPFEDVNIICTAGLYRIEINGKDKVIHHELLMAIDKKFSIELISKFLLNLAEWVISKEEATLRGKVIGPFTPISEETTMNAVYCTFPSFFDEDFYIVPIPSQTVIIPWIVPIYELEANYILSHGWELFEDQLEETEVDLFDLNREVIPFVH